MSSETEVYFVGQVTQKALIRRGDKFLMVTYVSGDSAHGLWDMPGGRLNEGEAPEEGLRREVREEIGAEVIIGNLLGTDTFTNMSNKRNFLVVFNAVLKDPNAPFIFEVNKVDRIEWFPKEALLKLPIIYPEYKELLKKYL